MLLNQMGVWGDSSGSRIQKDGRMGSSEVCGLLREEDGLN